MATLLLRLAAPLQAWGSSSKFNIRMTEREPTKSGVIGMIAAALGIKRNENSEELRKLAELKFGIRVEREGKLIRDFHMVYTGDLSDSQRRHKVPKSYSSDMHITERYYLSDAVFLAVLESDDISFLDKISEAVRKPVFPLFLGRRSCPPTLPVFIGISNDNMMTVLKTTESLTEKRKFQDSGEYLKRRIIYDDSQGSVAHDVPVSFSQLHRQYGCRMKNEEIIMLCEHDPFEEL